MFSLFSSPATNFIHYPAKAPRERLMGWRSRKTRNSTSRTDQRLDNHLATPITGATLRGADLRGVNFRDVTLRDADLPTLSPGNPL